MLLLVVYLAVSQKAVILKNSVSSFLLVWTWLQTMNAGGHQVRPKIAVHQYNSKYLCLWKANGPRLWSPTSLPRFLSYQILFYDGNNSNLIWNFYFLFFCSPTGLYGLPLRTGKLKDLVHFDATFFGVHAKQAHVMDPQLRMLLELTHEALIDAGMCY